MGLPPVVVGLAVYLLLSRSGPLGALGILFTPEAMVIAQTILVVPIIAALTRQTIEDLWVEYRDELGRDGCRPGAPRRDAVLGRAILPGHGAACRFRARCGGSRRHHHRRRQYRRLHPHHDHGDRAGNLQGRSAARDRARHGADVASSSRSMRWPGARAAPANAGRDDDARATERSSDHVAKPESRSQAGAANPRSTSPCRSRPGPPTVMVGPNGAGKTTLLRVCMGLIAPVRRPRHLGRPR